MELTNDLISQFVKVTNDRNTKDKEITVYGKIVTDGTQDYVEIDGSKEWAPIETTVEINKGERVLVTIQNHHATVTGNMDNPSIGVKTADGLRSSITQTASEIRLEVADEVLKLQSSITVTASEIRSEVSDIQNGLSSSIEQTAKDIRSEVSDLEKNLSSSITQNEKSIESLVKSGEEFSKFQQTVEGFKFMGGDGEVLISSGDINLTGAITWSDFDAEAQQKVTDATDTANSAKDTADSAKSTADTAKSTADSALSTAKSASSTASSAYSQAGSAITAANSASEVAGIAYQLAASVQLPSYLKSTYIDSTTVMSPSIIGGVFYAVGNNTWLQVEANGLAVYRSGMTLPRISMYEYSDNNIEMILGAGDFQGENRLYIHKDAQSASIYYVDGYGQRSGFTFSNGTINVIGTLVT